MNSLNNLFLSALLILFCMSCKKDLETHTALEHIPASATSVSSIDLERLLQKADFDEIRNMAFYKEMVSNANQNKPGLAAALKDPMVSGIDLRGNIFIATDLNKDNPELVMTHIMIPLRSASDFEALLEESGIDFITKDAIKIHRADGGPVLSWSDELAILTITNDRKTDLETKVLGLYSLPNEESVANNTSFHKAMEGSHDMISWFSTDGIARNPAAGLAMSMVDVEPDALQGNYIYSYADFEDGKMVGRAEFDVNRALGKDFIARFFKDEVNTDFSTVLPSENLAFAMSAAFDPVGIDRFLSERPQSKEYADFALNEMGFDRRELLELFNGDMMVAAYGNESIQNGSFLIAAQTKNGEKVKSWLEQAVSDRKLEEVEPGYYKIVTIGGKDFTITVNKGLGKLLHHDGMLIFSTDNTLLDKIRQGAVVAQSGETSPLEHFEEQTVAGWFNFPVLQKAVGGTGNGNTVEKIKFNINEDGADFIMETNEPATNSLKTIFRLINEAYLHRDVSGQEVL